jgi:hypothetical protein
MSKTVIVTPFSVVVGYRRFGRPVRPVDGGSVEIRNVDILPQHYAVSQLSEDGYSKVLRNVGILPQHYTSSQHREDGGSMDLRNIGILPQHYMSSQHREDGGSMDLRNIDIVPQHYTLSQDRLSQNSQSYYEAVSWIKSRFFRKWSNVIVTQKMLLRFCMK